MKKKPVEIRPFLKREALPEQVFRQLVSLVQTGDLKPGDKLPPQRALAEDLGIGRPTLREALRALQLLGILDIRHGGGVYVSETQPDTLLGPLNLYVNLDLHNLKTILEARKVIEGAVLAFVARNISDELIARLEGNLKKLEQAIEQPDQAALHGPQLNLLAQEFRDIIEEAAGNPILIRAIKSLDILSAATRMRLAALASPQRLLLDHKRMVEALLAHDSAAAQRALETHIDHLSACCDEVDGQDDSKRA